MLSTENPPPDLPCSCEISQLNTISSSDERASDNTPPLPNFSIRDYVFGTRGKDVESNWPFSQKNLQLCLKYGVKDVLPPFQSLDSVRNPSLVKCAAQNLRYSDGNLSELSDRAVGQNLAVDIENINSGRSEFKVGASEKVGSNIQNTVKKCRLIVKSNNTAERKPNEDLVVNTPLISETMASKVCPVCKTFSSSSNTTLNAHIDQCLSGESTVKWTTNSKVIKHRIKPRKTRLMVDIYETALHCTLEDLDRRNGTNWASNLGLPARDSEACAVDKMNEPHYSVNIEDINEGGDVYVDSNGTKLRILSKLSDLPSSSNASYDCGPSKYVKSDKGNKFLLSKKKKYLVQKQKLLNHCLYGQGSCSPRPDHCPEPEVSNGKQKNHVTQPRMAYDQMKSNDLGMIKQWVGSKRSGLKEKVNLEHESQHQDKLKKNSRIKSGVSSLGDTLVKRNSASKSLISSDKNPLLAAESHKRKKKLFCNPHDGCNEQQPCSRKGPGIFSMFNVKQSRNDSLSVHDGPTDSPNGLENHVSSRNDKKLGIDMIPAVENDSFFVSSRMSQHHTFSSLGRATPSGSKKFSSLRKKLLSVRHASIPESKKKTRRMQKHLDFKKRRLHCKSGSEEEAVVSRTAVYRQDNPVETPGENEAQMEQASSKSSINKTRVLEFQKKRGGLSLKGSETSPKSDSHGGVGKNGDSFTGGNFPVDTYNVKIRDEFVCEPSYEIADGEAFVAFSKSLDSAFTGHAGPNMECVSQHYNKAYVGHCQAELVLDGEQEMFYSDKGGKDHEVREVNTGEAQRNYYDDVDPIPIPGPPGSFLPSPGRMGSVELQGISSLTTCRVQSSEDELEIVDMDSSDSPISAMSVVSNFVAPISMQSHVRKTLPENNPTPEPEKIATNSSMVYGPTLVSNNSEAMFTAYGDCESPTPSTSNPVLRLMGKNLMVVNKDENRSSQTRLTQSSVSTIENPGPWLCVDNDLSTSNIHNEHHSFHRILSGGPSILENMQTGMPAQHFDDRNLSGYGFKVPVNFRPLQLSARPSTVMLSSKSFGGNFTSPLKSHEYASGCNSISDPLGSNTRLDAQTAYDNSVGSSSSKRKEIIVIDDSPESHEAGLAMKATHSGGVNPFYGYQTRGYPLCAGSPIFQSGNAQVPFSNGMDANLREWINCTAEGSRVVHPNSLTASVLPTAAQLRSSLYFSPGFS